VRRGGAVEASGVSGNALAALVVCIRSAFAIDFSFFGFYTRPDSMCRPGAPVKQGSAFALQTTRH
jgi:hypothetical protein